MVGAGTSAHSGRVSHQKANWYSTLSSPETAYVCQAGSFLMSVRVPSGWSLGVQKVAALARMVEVWARGTASMTPEAEPKVAPQEREATALLKVLEGGGVEEELEGVLEGGGVVVGGEDVAEITVLVRPASEAVTMEKELEAMLVALAGGAV